MAWAACRHVGAALLGELADRLGLTRELGRRANRGVRAGGHDRGQVLRDLVVMLADGGDCVSDLAVLRDQPELFGQVASTPTAWRVLAEELSADPRGIAGLWSALARVRGQAWALGMAPVGPLLLDLDATLIQAHSDKQGAAPTYKQDFGFHPLGCWLDRGDGPTGTAQAAAGPADAGPSRLRRRDPRLHRRAGPPQPCVFDRVRLRPARPASDPRAARAGMAARRGPRRPTPPGYLGR